jgi:hypothetical protein
METQVGAQLDEEAPRWSNPLTLTAGLLFFLDLALKYVPAVANPGAWPKNGGIDAIGLALAGLAMLPWIARNLSSAKLPGGIDLVFTRIERRQNLTEEAVRQLRFIVDGFLTRFEFEHLLAIKRGDRYTVKSEEAQSLAAELRRLRALGLIMNVAKDRGVTDFARASGDKKQISRWFELTNRGLEYLRMRDENSKLAPTGTPVLGQASAPQAGAILEARGAGEP